MKLGEILANLSNPQLRSQAEQCGTLIRRYQASRVKVVKGERGSALGFHGKMWWYPVCPLALTVSPQHHCVSLPLSIPTMLSVHSEQLHKTGFPTVHAVVLLEGTMNLTGETQPLVEQLMMVKRMQVGGAE